MFLVEMCGGEVMVLSESPNFGEGGGLLSTVSSDKTIAFDAYCTKEGINSETILDFLSPLFSENNITNLSTLPEERLGQISFWRPEIRERNGRVLVATNPEKDAYLFGVDSLRVGLRFAVPLISRNSQPDEQTAYMVPYIHFCERDTISFRVPKNLMDLGVGGVDLFILNNKQRKELIDLVD